VGIVWLDAPTAHDFEGAASFLSLCMSQIEVHRMLRQLKMGAEAHFAAKDVLRQSGLALLDKTDSQVRHVLAKVGASGKFVGHGATG
jgi:hypothetical protein